MSSYKLSLIYNSRSECPNIEHEVDGKYFLVADYRLPQDYNPHNTKLWYIGVQWGFEWKDLAVVWANYESEALDIACDANMLDYLLDDDQNCDDESLTSLGNAGELFNLENLVMFQVELKKDRDFNLYIDYVRADERQLDTLEFIA